MVVAVIFGGKSCEHDVSMATGRMTIAALAHDTVPVYIDYDGTFYSGKIPDDPKSINVAKLKKVYFKPNDRALYCGKKVLAFLDAAVICLHGLNGEDGSVSGLLQLSGIPFVGPGIAAAATSLDKAMMKKIFTAVSLPITPYFLTDKFEFVSDAVNLSVKAKELGFPLIVKPCSLGSSIGINIAKNDEELFDALSVAFEWDTRAVVEKALVDFQEFNCAVLGYGREFIVSEVEQPIGWKDYLSFADKYGRGLKQGRKFPAPIEPALKDKIKDYALRAYKALECDGISRVDFMYKDEQLFVNEINTVPGSLAYYLFSDKFSFSALLDKAIEFAVARNRDFERLDFRFSSPINISSK